ncbi:MAG: hypothetical protein ACP5VS_05670 [Desulfomonilaceae bacterium]
MVDQITNFLQSLYNAYCDNAQMWHYAEHVKGGIYSTMPTTSFVYNFFIYNSVYQYDWETSVRCRKLTLWAPEQESQIAPRLIKIAKSDSEFSKQKRLEKFMRKKCKKNQALLQIAFEPLTRLTDLEGPWTSSFPDLKMSQDTGANFFTRLRELSQTIIMARETSDQVVKATKQNFELIQKCRYFVYNVRNSIFQGSNTLADTWDKNQEKRLAHYDLFLKCLLGLFFICHDMNPLPKESLTLSTDRDSTRVCPTSNLK